MASLRDSLPPSWTVSTSDHTYTISSRALRNELTSSTATEAASWTASLAEEVESYSSPGAANPAKAKAELDQILAKPEFAAVRPPSAWELFKLRLQAWLLRMLEKLFGSISRHPIGGQIVFWVLIFVGVVLIGALLIRFLASRDRMQSLPPSAAAFASRSWQEWIRLAREAANRNDFRDAIHSAYWAGVARLEDMAIVPRDRTKTPREYLRIVTDKSAGELATRYVLREPLAALTTRLERVWYANRGASREDFQDSLKQLEALGCPLE
jgi:hypothetical protein